MKDVLLGIIGYGSIGRRHSLNAEQMGVRVIRWDSDPMLQSERSVCNSEEQFWCPGLTHVLIASPAETHEHYLRECVDRGLPVFIEKPLAMAWAPELETLVLKARLTSAVGFNWRCHPGVREMRRLTTGLRFHCEDDMDEWPGQYERDALLEGCHELDLALWFYGEPQGVRVDADGPLRVTVALSYEELDKHQEPVGIVLNLKANEQRRGFSCGDHFTAWADLAPSDYSINQMYRDELARFLEGHPVASLHDGLRVMKLIDRIREAGKVQTVRA